MQKCLAFSKRSATTQQAVEFGQSTTKKRSTEEIARDNMIGKMAEVAFAKIMGENYGVPVGLDFNYYPRGQWDDQDALINGWRIDVKGTRPGAKWLLVEWNKLNFRQRNNNLSHAYVAFTVGWDRETDTPEGWVRFEGLASLCKMKSDCKTTKTLRKGELIPGTRAMLQADNYGIRFTDLSKDLDRFVSFISKNQPVGVVERFRNPYTNGEVQ